MLNHPQQPMRFRRFVSTVLLSAARSPTKKLSIELWTVVLSHVKFDDFTDRDRLLEIATLKVRMVTALPCVCVFVRAHERRGVILRIMTDVFHFKSEPLRVQFQRRLLARNGWCELTDRAPASDVQPCCIRVPCFPIAPDPPQVEIARCTREQERLAAEYAAEEAMFAFVWLVVSAKGGNAEPKDPGAVLARLDADKTQLTLTQAGLLARKAELERRLQGEMRLRE